MKNISNKCVIPTSSSSINVFRLATDYSSVQTPFKTVRRARMNQKRWNVPSNFIATIDDTEEVFSNVLNIIIKTKRWIHFDHTANFNLLTLLINDVLCRAVELASDSHRICAVGTWPFFIIAGIGEEIPRGKWKSHSSYSKRQNICRINKIVQQKLREHEHTRNLFYLTHMVQCIDYNFYALSLSLSMHATVPNLRCDLTSKYSNHILLFPEKWLLE